MRYPNAASGVKKILASEILNLIAIVCLSGALTFTAVVMFVSDGMNDDTKAMLALVCLPLLIGAAVPAIVGYILKIIGLNKARLDEPAFKTAFYCVFISLAATIFQAAFSGNANVVRVMDLISDVSDLLIVIYIITGVRNLSVKMGRNDLDRTGMTIFKIMVSMFMLIIIADILSIIFGGVGIVAASIAIAAGVLGVVQYILYIVFLVKANNMLKKQ